MDTLERDLLLCPDASLKAATDEMEAKLQESERKRTEALSELQMLEAPDIAGHFCFEGAAVGAHGNQDSNE